MPIYPSKSTHEKTRGEIIAAMIAFVVLGGTILAGMIYTLATRRLGWFTIIPATGCICVSYGIISTLLAGRRELKRRANQSGGVERPQ